MPHEDHVFKGFAEQQAESTADKYVGEARLRDLHPDVAEKLQAKSSVGCTATRFSPLQAWLQADLDKISPLYRNTLRAQDILRRHPDFEELIELLTLLGVNIPGLAIARG
jgi:hypothetical protein